MKITHCKVNHLVNPLGYQMKFPTFSYIVEGANGHFQKAARIQVFQSPDLCAPIYDSGLRTDMDSLAFTAEFALTPRTRYYWTVTVQTDAGEEETSSVNWFETAKQTEAWAGQWITCDSTTGRHPIFSKSFSVQKPLRTARLYICGLGLYRANLDGEKIGNEYLAPGCNNYQSWLQYQTYEFENLATGKHTLSVLLGNGWYKGRFGSHAKCVVPSEQPPWKLIAELHLLYEDGSEEVVPTNETWQISRSALTASSIYDGEKRDDTLQSVLPVPAVLLEETMPALQARLSTPVTVHKELPAIELLHTPAGETVLDLGQNFAGVFRMRVHEPEGTQIHLQFGEILQNGNFYRENLRSALQEYVYVSDGKAHILEPNFTFYGYRYVKVEGMPHLNPSDFVGLVLYSEIPQAGSLRTGNKLVNQLAHNAEWGQRSNFIDIPTDCPQRDERLGWTGDAQVFSPTACYQYDCYAFYNKYLADMATEQAARGGCVPNVIPAVDNETAAVWGDAACIIPWNLYQFYGDLSILKERFADMKAWVDYISRIDEGTGKWRSHFQWGDWLALDNPSDGEDQVFGGTDAGFIADVYYMNSAETVSKSAALLGENENAEKYKKLAQKIRQRILYEFYSPSGRCCIATQTACLLTLKYHLSKDEKGTVKMLRTLFSQKRDKLQTGFVGTPILCNVLSDYGMDDLAYKLLLNEEYPGWLYAVKMGATTIWERWNSVKSDGSVEAAGMSSLNHYTYGSVVEWIWRRAVGITQAAGVPGFRSVRFQPTVHEALQFAEGKYHSAAGTWHLKWEIVDDRCLKIAVTVPFNCTAELVLPFAPSKLFQSVQNPIFKDVKDGICHLVSGSYEIVYETTVPLLSRLSMDNTVGELRANSAASELLHNRIPGFDMLPAELNTVSLRPFLLQYGHNMGITSEILDELDDELSKL